MENASKALIIAGAILISILVVSLGVMTFNNMSNSVSQNSDLTKEKITSFNSKITPNLGKNVSGSQVNALIQLARTIDQKAINEADEVKFVTITGVGTVTKSGDTVSYTNVPTGTYYTVLGEYDSNGLITRITISKNP